MHHTPRNTGGTREILAVPRGFCGSQGVPEVRIGLRGPRGLRGSQGVPRTSGVSGGGGVQRILGDPGGPRTGSHFFTIPVETGLRCVLRPKTILQSTSINPPSLLAKKTRENTSILDNLISSFY